MTFLPWGAAHIVGNMTTGARQNEGVELSYVGPMAENANRGKWLNIGHLARMERVLQHTSTNRRESGRMSQHERGGQMKSILDPTFRYTKSVETDLRKTFARVRREQRRQQQEQSTVGVDMMRNILPFGSRKVAS